MALSTQDRNDIKLLSSQGYSLAALAATYQVSGRRISQILSEDTADAGEVAVVEEAREKLRRLREADSPQKRLIDEIFAGLEGAFGDLDGDPAERVFITEQEAADRNWVIPPGVSVLWQGRSEGRPVSPPPDLLRREVLRGAVEYQSDD